MKKNGSNHIAKLIIVCFALLTEQHMENNFVRNSRPISTYSLFNWPACNKLPSSLLQEVCIQCHISNLCEKIFFVSSQLVGLQYLHNHIALLDGLLV